MHRLFLTLFLLAFSGTAFALWTPRHQGCTAETLSACSGYAETSGKPTRITEGTSQCADGSGPVRVCEYWTETTSPCAEGSHWDQASMSCTGNCGPGLSWNSVSQQCESDSQQCPEGTKKGLKSGPDGTLVEACISDEPPPQECPEGSNQVGSVTHEDGSTQPICDNQHQCPSGYNPGIVSGEQVCHPDTSNPDCPNGGFHGTFNDTTGCFNPDPNVDNPDYPPNSNPGSPSYPGDPSDPNYPTYPNDPNWPSANNPNYTGGDTGSSSSGGTTDGSSFDDSRIVAELQSLNSKASQTNGKLDGIDGKLGEIKDGLSGVGSPTPDIEISPSRVKSFYESKYPNGIAGIWADKSSDFQSTEIFEYLNQYRINYTGGGMPEWELCLDFELGSFGCHALAPPAYIWAFLKLCVLVTAGFLCRALIFGG